MTEMKTEQARPVVLAVNDEPKVLELLTVILEQEGYKVVCAADGPRALETAHAVGPDIVISDVVMPGMDGLELCRRLKQDPRTAFVPVLLASALRTGKRSNLSALTAGADDYLEMPFRRQELLVKVARLTERHRIERLYREIVEQAADIIYTRDLDGRITSMNEAGAHFFGRPIEELVGSHLSTMLGEETAADIIANTREHTSNEPLRWVHQVADARGVAHHLEGMITLMRDAQGAPTGARTVIRDITERVRAEEALRESEERYRRLVELSPEMIAVHRNGVFIYINAAGTRLLGATSPNEVVGREVLSFVHPDYLEIVKARIERVKDEGETAELIEEKLIRLDGRAIEVEVTGIPITYLGEPAVQLIVREITQRKLAEEELRREKEFNERLINSSVDGILAFDTECRYTVWNPAMERMSGVGHEQTLGRCAFDVFPFLKETGEDRFFYDALAGRTVVARDRPYRVHGGGEGFFEGHYSPLFSQSGEIVGGLGVIRDITERVRADEALTRSEERYRELFENANDIVYTHDLQGNFTSLNKTGEKATGYTRDEALRMNIAQVVVPEQVERARQMIARKTSEDTSTLYELDIVAKDGRRVPLEVSTRLIYDGGRPVGVQGIARDVTERKRVKEELQASEAELRALFAAMPDVIFVLDAEGRYLKVAPTNPALLYRPPAELVGKTLHEVFPRAQADLFLGYIVRAIEERQPVTIDYSLTIEGHEVWFEGTVSPMPAGTVLWVARDMTERKRAGRLMEQQAEREAVVNRITSAVRRSLDISEVFNTAVRELGSYLDVDRCTLFMKEPGRIRLMAEYNVPGVRPAERDFPLSGFQELIDGVERHGVLAFDDAANDQRIGPVYDSFLRAAGVRSIMYVGIRAGNEMPAAFSFSTTRSLRHWRDEDMALARAVADQTGIAIRQAELYQRAEATSARESLINRLSLTIRASLSLPEVLSTATRELGRALQASRVHLYMYDPERPRARAEHEYVAPNSTSVKNLEVSFDEPIAQRLLRSPGPVVIHDALTYAEGPAEFSAQVRSHADKFHLRSQIIYPLIVNGRFRAALCIHQTDRVRRWTEDEVALVEAVATQLATGIAQAELFEMTGRAKKEWETTFNAMSDGIFIFDNAGQLIRVNRAGAAMEDTWPHLMLGRRCCDILRTSEGNTCIVERTIAEGRSVTIEIVPERFNRPLLVTAEPIIEKGSKTIGAVCTARDLSELRKAEAKAREQQSLLMNILESARESIYAVDTEGRFQWFNTATTVATGYKPEDLIGHSFLDITFEADRETAHDHFKLTLEGRPQTYEARFLSTDGGVRYALFDTAPLVVDGYTTGVLGIARDITEQKQERQRAAQADKLRALGQLASGVAHDFNNALTAILGRAQLMRRQIQDQSLTHNLDVIQTAAEDAASTVRRIQTFARQSPDKEFELLDASSLLRDAIEITRTRWENEARLRGLRYDVELRAGCPYHVMGNASELREVFVNLIVNAVDAMPEGGRLVVSCERAGDRLALRFEDTGVGMPEDVRERIFEPFYTTKGAHGTGLGLAVSYGIIERHGGHFNVESEEGQGTTFEISLPASTQAAEYTPAPRVEMGAPSISVLVVDDEEFVRETLADMLKVMGHEVKAVAGGHEALQELEASEFDLVFTDLSMPEMDGWELAREVRRRKPSVSIIMATGHGAVSPLDPADRDLVDAVIGKPFDFDQVAVALAQAMSRRSETVAPGAAEKPAKAETDQEAEKKAEEANGVTLSPGP